LFFNKSDSIGTRFKDLLESIVKPGTGMAAENMQAIDLIKDMVKNDHTAEKEFSQVYTQKRMEYITLSTIQDMMAVQKSKIQDNNGSIFSNFNMLYFQHIASLPNGEKAGMEVL
jgi:hypothetical protein